MAPLLLFAAAAAAPAPAPAPAPLIPPKFGRCGIPAPPAPPAAPTPAATTTPFAFALAFISLFPVVSGGSSKCKPYSGVNSTPSRKSFAIRINNLSRTKKL